jgi:hypothetical protein
MKNYYKLSLEGCSTQQNNYYRTVSYLKTSNTQMGSLGPGRTNYFLPVNSREGRKYMYRRQYNLSKEESKRSIFLQTSTFYLDSYLNIAHCIALSH